MLTSLLVACSLALVQDVIPASPFDRVVEVELDEGDPLEGHGPAAWIDYEVEFSGALHVWTSSELDLFLRVEYEDGELLGEDGASGGGTTPYLCLPVDSGDVLLIAVAGTVAGTTGAPSLHLVAAPETEVTRSAVKRGRESLRKAEELRRGGEHESARRSLASTIDALRRTEEVYRSDEAARVAWDLGLAAYGLGDLPSALPALSIMRVHHERALPTSHPDLLPPRVNLAVVMAEQGDFPGAREILETVLESCEQTFPADHPQILSTRRVLANTMAQMGDFAAARALHEALLETLERTLPTDHPELIGIRGNLALTLKGMGDLAGARALQEAVVEALERTLPPEHPDVLSARANLSVTMESMGDLASARSLQEAVLEAYERTLPADHPRLLGLRQNLAVTLKQLGDLAGARALEVDVLEASERVLPADHPHLLGIRLNLAATMRVMGDLAGARALNEAVVEAYERTVPEDHLEFLSARHNLAVTMYQMGDLAGARALLETVIKTRERVLPADHRDLLAARQTLAGVMAQMGDFDGVRGLSEAVVESLERTFPADHPDVLKARWNLAAILARTGDLADARVMIEEVLETQERVLPANHSDLLTTRMSLAAAMNQMGELVAARDLVEAVLDARERTLPEDHGPLAATRQTLAEILLQQGDRAGARAILLDLASGLRLHARSAALQSPREARAAVGTYTRLLGEIASLNDAADLESRRALFELVETRRAAATEALRTAARVQANEELRELWTEVVQARGALNDLVTGRVREGISSEDFRDAMTEMSARRDRAEKAIRAALAEAGGGPAEISLESLGSAAPTGSALVGFLRYPAWKQDPGTGRVVMGKDHLLAHVLCSDGRLTRLDLGPIEELRPLVASWRAALGASIGRGVVVKASDSSEELERQAGELLREKLIDPVLDALDAPATILHVCPDDLAFLVPLDALPAPSSGSGNEDRLGDRVQIVIQSSFAGLVAPLPEADGEPALLALGAPAYDAEGAAGKMTAALAAPVTAGPRSGAAGSFLPLTQTGPEIQSIRELFERTFGASAEVLKEEGATKAALTRAVTGARYLHLATHGWFAPETVRSIEDDKSTPVGEHHLAPMSAEDRTTGFAPSTLCGLALAGANRGMDSFGRVSGIMTAEELASLDLSDCELAVLSACETSVGHFGHAGQGIQSLQTALHAAGARTAITSLWKVDDAATRKLMELFYTYLWVEKLPVAEALWKAKSDLRKDGHPTRHWAGWVLSGEAE